MKMNHKVTEPSVRDFEDSDNKVLKRNAMKAGVWRPTIALGFDGVIHRYRKGWQDGKIYDEPVLGVEIVLEELSQSFRLMIFTTRDPNVPDGVWDWLKKYDLHRFFKPGDVTNVKPPAMVYVDARGCRFDGKWTVRAMMDIKKLAMAGVKE